MSRVLGPILGFVLFFVGFVGYLYYGPPHHTHFVTRTKFYQKSVAPVLDSFLGDQGVGGFSVGYLADGQGELSFRNSSALVYKPARVGQRFFGGTVVSTGPDSKGYITLFDDSVLELAANTTVILEVPEVNELGAVIDLQVVSGEINAEKKSSQNIQLKVSNKKTVTTIQQKQKLSLQEQGETLLAPISTGLNTPSVSPEPTAGLEQLQERNLQVPETGELQISSLEPVSDFVFELPVLDIEGSSQQMSENMRQPAAIEEPEPDWPLEIAPRVIPRRRKTTVIKIKEFEAPPELNALSNALFAQKNGKYKEAHRFLAQSLTRKDYFDKTFTEASRFAINGLVENYLTNKECDLALAVIENVKTAFEKSAPAQEWVKSWQIKSIKSCGQL